MRFRHIYMLVGSLLMILILIVTDPDTGVIQSMTFGASTVATLVILLKSVLYVAMLHFSRKGLIDYVDLKTFFDKALQTSEGSGRALMAVGLIMISIALTIYAATSS